MDKTSEEKYEELEKRVAALEGSVQAQLQCALNNLNKFKRKATLAKTKKEKQVLLEQSQFLEMTINRAMDLLCL